MEESEYIFDSGNSLYHFTIIISCVLSMIIIYYLIKLKINYNDKDLRSKYLVFIGLLLVFSLMMIFGSRSDKKRFDDIKDNLGITVGTTIKHEVGDGFNYITFDFKVNGKNYTSQCGMTYNGYTIDNIIVPNGRYKVLYNKKNPKMAVMDFRVKK